MDFYKDFNKQADKLAETLADFNLLHTFDTKKFPITLTVRQNKAPDAQMELYATTDGSISAQDSVLRFIFKLDEIEIQTDSRLVISDHLMTKIKGAAKKLHYSYLQAYFADRRNAERMDLYGDPDEGGADEPAGEDTEEAANEGEAFAGFYDDENVAADGENVANTEADEIEDGAGE